MRSRRRDGLRVICSMTVRYFKFYAMLANRRKRLTQIIFFFLYCSRVLTLWRMVANGLHAISPYTSDAESKLFASLSNCAPKGHAKKESAHDDSSLSFFPTTMCQQILRFAQKNETSDYRSFREIDFPTSSAQFLYNRPKRLATLSTARGKTNTMPFIKIKTHESIIA